MAHSNRNNALIEELVAEVSKLSLAAQPKEFKKWRDFALRISKSNQFGRVNQFQVDSTLNGLTEKFQVLNRDDLATGLEQKLLALRALSDKWTPEILFLLLELSDQPVKNTEPFLDVEKTKSPEPASLTWEDVLKDNPYSDDELWKDGSFSPISSDSEDDLSISSGASEPTPQTTVDEELESQSKEHELFIEVDDALLSSLQGLQFWNSDVSVFSTNESEQVVPELYAIREVLFVLRGLPTLGFNIVNDSKVVYRGGYNVTELTASSMTSIMETFAKIADQILELRAWMRKPQSDVLLQAFRASIQSQLLDFDKNLGKIESSFVSPKEDVIVSLLNVLDQVRSLSRPLVYLALVVKKVSRSKSEPFFHLELLYDCMCEQQLSGDLVLYEFFGSIFFASLQSYLNPIRRWMQEGLVESSNSSFFIQEAQEPLDDASIWHDQFRLRQNDRGHLLAPKFIEASSRRILNTGKSIRFLNKLGAAVPRMSQAEKALSFESVCQTEDGLSLLPFPGLFDQAFERWIQDMYTPTSTILRDQLFNRYHLRSCLLALEELYLSKDGTRLQALADPIFSALDTRSSSANDKYLISERVKTVFNDCPHVNTDLLAIRSTPVKAIQKTVRAASNVFIAYHLPWPVLNVVRKQSLVVYQRIFRLLLQIYRAKYLLRQTIFLRGKDTSNASAISLKHNLQWFVDSIHSYIVNTVLHPSTERLHQSLSAAQGIDEMTDAHDQFISSVQAQCLLSKNLSPIYQSITSILDITVQFSECRHQQLGVRPGQTRKSSASQENTRRKSSAWSRRKARRTDDSSTSESEGDDDDVDDSYDADTETLNVKQGSPDERMRRMKEEVDRLCSLLVTGLRAISRAEKRGGEAWEMLADQLDWDRSTDRY